jgi:hypothetical protein
MPQKSQWLFEAPVILNAGPHLNFSSPPVWEFGQELHAPSSLGEHGAGYPRHAQTVRETISGFPRYSNLVKSLPLQEQRKIELIAQQIINSFRLGHKPIRTVRLVGYADRDTPRRPGFEQKISSERVEKVNVALIEAIERLSKPLGALPPISIRIHWQRIAAGATQLVVQNPRSELERARNRRVEVYFPSPGFYQYQRGANREVEDPQTLSPKLQRIINEFLKRVGERPIDRSNCFQAATSAAKMLSPKTSSQKVCKFNYAGWQLVEAKLNEPPLSRNVVCYPWTSDYYGVCKKARYQKIYGHCSGVDGRYVVLKYKPLTKIITEFKNVLDSGCLVKAGVLSGMCDDKPDIGCARKLTGQGQAWRDCPEHWLLIIGYDGDKFLFWDSAQMSNIVRGEHVFGLLHFNSAENRLTTAPVTLTQNSTQDPMAVTPRKNSGDSAGGWHVFDTRQKRYQVLALRFAGWF